MSSGEGGSSGMDYIIYKWRVPSFRQQSVLGIPAQVYIF